MKITKDFRGLIQTSKGDYVYPDELIVIGDSIDIDLDGNLLVVGDLSSDGGIFVCCGLEVSGNVYAKGNITVGWNLRALGSIKSEEGIVAVRGGIYSGGCIEAKRDIVTEHGVYAAAWIRTEEDLRTNGEITSTEATVDGGIIAGGFIWIWRDLTTKDGIICEGEIQVGGTIDCQKRIFAGVSLFDADEERCLIRCGALKNGTICAGELNLTKKE